MSDDALRLSANKRIFDRATLLVFLAAVAVSFISATLRNRLHNLPFAEEAIIAGHLIHGDGFLSPYDASPQAPPSCYSPPLYPLCIELAYRIAGVSRAIPVLLMLNSICFGVIAAGAFWLGRFYRSTLAGVLAALLIVSNPILLYFATDWWDSFVALAIYVALLPAAAIGATRHARRAAGAMGAAMGVLSLFNPSYALSFPVLILVTVRREAWKQRIIAAVVSLLAFAVVLAPWTIRNYRLFDRLYFVRDGFSLQVWEGMQSLSSGWLDGDMLQVNPSLSARERNLVLRLGEPAYFDLCSQRVEQAIRANPAAFLRRSLYRIYFIFMSDPTRAFLPLPMMNDVRWQQIYVDRAILHGAMTLLGFAGLYMSWRLRFGCGWIFLATLLAEAAFVVSVGADRYSLPMDVVLLFYAGVFLNALFTRLRTGGWPAPRH
jgi:hypothetical protein